MTRLASSTDLASRDVGAGILVYGRPPELTLNQGLSVTNSRVAGKTTGMHPLEHLGADRVRHKQSTWRTMAWI